MRVLRSTIYAHMYAEPFSMVIRDCDSRDTLESNRVKLKQSTPDALLTFDIFTMPDGGIEEATRVATQRELEHRETEKHMATLYYWLVHNIFPQATPQATIGMNKPAPLSPEDMRFVLSQITEHPAYEDFSIIGVARDGTCVQVVQGVVE